MPAQNNFIRPSSTYSASSTMKLDSTESARKKTSVVILTLLSMIIFLFILCELTENSKFWTAALLNLRLLFVYVHAISQIITQNLLVSSSAFVFLSFSALLLICALVVVGKGLSAKSDKLFEEPKHQISSISLINRAINPNRNTINTIDTKSRQKLDMSLGKMASKLVENLTFRLPAAIRPTAYNLFLNPNLETKTFSGNVKIDFSVSEATPLVALHSKFLNVTTNKLIKNLENGAEGIAIKSAFEYEKFEYFIVEPEAALSVGNYTIDLSFDGSLDGKIVGFYGSSYFDKTKNQTR